MADMDLASLTAPIDDALPCGPDLDAKDDDAFANYVSATEMSLPEQYFVEDHEGTRRPFFTDDRFKELSLKGFVTAGVKLLARTRDLRLLCLIAKVEIFNRNLGDFVTVVEAIAGLLETYWEEVHPDIGSGLRIGVLERLNEQFTIVTALNNVPLFRSKRYNQVTWQSYFGAVREVAGSRQDADTSSIDRILIEECKADPSQVAAAQATLARLAGALARIGAVCAEKLAGGQPDLQRLTEAIARIRAMLDRINPPADAPEVPAGDAESAAPVVGSPDVGGAAPFASTRAAERALALATQYLTQTEPSSPALLLLRQAQALVGKSFLEVIDSLLPDQARRATVSVASFPVFSLPLRQLAEQGVASRSDEDEQDEDEAASPSPLPGSRAEALALLDRVGVHFRIAEPSSPIPMLIDRARDLVGKDFMSLIRTMLPDSVLRGD